MKIFLSLIILLLEFLLLGQTNPVFATDVCCPKDAVKVNNACYKTENGVQTEVRYLALCGQEYVCDQNTNTCIVQSQGGVEKVFGQIIPPASIQFIGSGSSGISNLLSKIIELIYVVAGVVFVFMVIVSAFQWIVSGGDKEAVAKARGRLTYAIIGIIILALSFVIISTVGKITGFEFFAGQIK